MGYLKDFEEDVFISYATIDNDRYPGEPVGWVAQFHEDLTKRLKGRLGSDVVRLWRDIEIRNNEDFTNKIMARLSKTATLIGVLSPSFLNRTWTLRELETFSRHASRGIGLLIKGEKSRIFKVEKLEIDRNSLPALMQGTKSYRFIKEETQREFRPYLESDRSGYLKQLDDLAIDIANLLCEMALPAPPADRIAVYVAETTRELADQLRDIRRELTAKGYTVLPEGDLPRQAEEYEMEVRKNLELAAISVHLIGAKYGLIPEGETRSIVRIQHDLAMERNADPDFVRLVWMPADLEPAEENQRKFVEFLRTDPKAQEGAEIMETKFDDLKTAMHDKIAAIKRLRERPKPPSPAGGEAGRPAAPAAIGATRTGSEYPTAEEPPTIAVTIKDHRFVPSEIHVATGKPTVLIVRNEDATAEEFESYELNREKVVAGKGQIVIFVGPLEPGRYPFFGDFHKETANGVLIAK